MNQQNAREGTRRSTLIPGTHLPSPDGQVWPGKKNTLVLAIRYGCVHCEKNMDFYRDLERKSEQIADRTNIVSIFPDDYVVASHDLTIHSVNNLPIIAKVDLRRLHVAGTPTLILVDKNGTILQSWVGELTKEQQEDVYKAIGEDSRRTS